MKTKLLVPTDFTNEAHSAIQHAVKLGVIIQAEVILLNVVFTCFVYKSCEIPFGLANGINIILLHSW